LNHLDARVGLEIPRLEGEEEEVSGYAALALASLADLQGQTYLKAMGSGKTRCLCGSPELDPDGPTARYEAVSTICVSVGVRCM
jgi:hypothetical protein